MYVLDDGADAELRENMARRPAGKKPISPGYTDTMPSRDLPSVWWWSYSPTRLIDSHCDSPAAAAARQTRELGLGTRPGLHYTVREDRRYAKAGNMQHGLRISSGDLICCFDADMVAHSDFLIRLVPHLLQHNAKLGRWQLSEEVGLVQTPQNFYNGDDQLVDDMDGKMAQLMKVFYPSFSGLGVAPCIGTGYIVQRQALEDVGGFACGLAVEDVTTSVLILVRRPDPGPPWDPRPRSLRRALSSVAWLGLAGGVCVWAWALPTPKPRPATEAVRPCPPPVSARPLSAPVRRVAVPLGHPEPRGGALPGDALRVLRPAHALVRRAGSTPDI